MKLLFISNLFPTPETPTRGVFSLQLVKSLSEICSVTVLCPLPWFPRIGSSFVSKNWRELSLIPGDYQIEGVNVICPKYLLIPKISENIHPLLMSLRIQSTIKTLHKEFKFDAVNTHWLYPDAIAVNNIVGKLGIPHTVTALGSDVNRELLIDSKKTQILKTLEDVSSITVVSNNLKTKLVEHNISSDKITVIHNGVDVNKFHLREKSACRKKLGISTVIPTVTYVGRLSSEKNICTLINAIKIVLDKGKQIRLLIVGDGPLRNELANQVEELGIEENITFTGSVRHDDIALWISATDYFCLPSLTEGCPNVVLEALSCGRPVIGSTAGAIPDLIVDSKNGFVFDPIDTKNLANLLLKSMDTNWNEYEIRTTVVNKTWDKVALRYLEIMKQPQVNL